MAKTTTTTQSISLKKFSLPRLMLGIEGLAVFVASLLLYQQQGGNWWLFAALLLSPDLVFIIYMLDKRAGTIAYNVAHTYTLPVILATGALLTGWQVGLTLAMIWFAHIGMDRTVGYGLKYQTGFNETHLQRVTDI